MNTKFAVALLSGISVFMSVGAFAVSEEKPADYMNWSYANGEVVTAVEPETEPVPAPVAPVDSRKCTAGCPSRPCPEDVRPMTLTYEDEAAPVVERVENFSTEDHFIQPSVKPVVMNESKAILAESQPEVISTETAVEQNINFQAPQIDTHYVQSAPKIQYPITRQYPISVQYPVTVQRNVTVEQPVVMQQPVIVRRPVVMQQDVTVQRQPTVVYQKPVIMQQQPTYIQQQPVVMQAPAAPVDPMMWQQQVMPSMMQPMPTVVVPPIPAQGMMTAPQQYQTSPMAQQMPVVQPTPMAQPMTVSAPVAQPAVQAYQAPTQPVVAPMVQMPYAMQ